MNKLGFAILLFAAIGIVMVGTLTEILVMSQPVYAPRCPDEYHWDSNTQQCVED